MAGSKPKQFTRPPPKKKAKANPVTADDFQEAADFEEAAGGKHRVGDPVKSGRAFLRALELYDNGLKKHPSNLDLAYNKARLQLEISQQPALVEHIGTPLLDWLELTLESHRHTLRLSQDNPDALFNTAQVLTSLAEELSEDDRSEEAVKPLQEALELLSSCLSRQEMMFEQHRLDFPDTEEGGVAVNPDEQPAPAATASAPSADTDMDEQSASVETPVSPNDLLDTVHASLSALTTLIPLIDEAALQNLGDMALALTEDKAPRYLQLLPIEEQDSARLSLALDRAVFIATYANSQFESQRISLSTYIDRLKAFDIPNKPNNAGILSAESSAHIELVLSALDRFGESSPNFPATLCWKHLSTSQDLLSQASKLTTEDATDRKPEIYKSKADLELLRHRLTLLPQKTDLSETIRNSGKTLISNAVTFYKGAVSLAQKVDDDEEVQEVAEGRGLVAREILRVLYGGEKFGERDGEGEEDFMDILEGCVDEGIVGEGLAGRIMMQGDGSGGGAAGGSGS